MMRHDSVVFELEWHFSPFDWGYGSQACTWCSGHWAWFSALLTYR
jgi:hypothetical protein